MSDIGTMKEWKPERQFQKADFPVKKKEDRPNDGGKKHRKGQIPDTGSKDAAAPSGRSGTADPSPGVQETRELKGWSVPRLEGGHVVAGGTGNRSGSTTNPGSGSDSKGAAKPSGSYNVDSGASGGNAQISSAEAAGNQQKKDMTRVYLSQLVAADPRGATDILRSWYWEKPGRESPVKYTPPKNRIHLILQSLTKESLLALYEMMTPVERRQMEEIRREPMHVNEREILKLRQYFMARLTGQI